MNNHLIIQLLKKGLMVSGVSLIFFSFGYAGITLPIESKIEAVVGTYGNTDLLTNQQLEKLLLVSTCKETTGMPVISNPDDNITGEKALQKILNISGYFPNSTYFIMDNGGNKIEYNLLPDNWDSLKGSVIYVKDFLPIASLVYRKKSCVEKIDPVIIDSATIDSDGDGIMDNKDKCKSVRGDADNEGCPIFEKECTDDSDCTYGTCSGGKFGVCIPPKKKSYRCLDKGKDFLIYGNIQCNACPCSYKVDFISALRTCDKVFSIISSPDGKKIYSRGEVFQIR